MAIHRIERTYATTTETDILDITADVTEAVRRSGVKEGQVLAFVPGSTASVTTIEYEEGVLDDLREAVERLAPRGRVYKHDARWGDMNGFAHVRAALLGSGLAIPVAGGRLLLGEWQQVVLLDFDNRPRERRLIVQVSGE